MKHIYTVEVYERPFELSYYRVFTNAKDAIEYAQMTVETQREHGWKFADIKVNKSTNTSKIFGYAFSTLVKYAGELDTDKLPF